MTLRTPAVSALMAAALVAGPALAAPATAAPGSTVGADSLGDPYFPRQGNGGYDVRHYDIAFTYDPGTRQMTATATITAVATQDLSRFSLDFMGPTVSAVTVNAVAATFSRDDDKLFVTPKSLLRDGRTFTVAISYAGEPGPMYDPDGSIEGWVPTDDGAFVVGEPQGSATWFPGNNHPTDKATFTFRATVPDGTTAVGNGTLASQSTHSGWTTFVWESREPMATYLATVTIGKFVVSESTTAGGVPVYTAVDPRLAKRAAPMLAEIPDIVGFFSTVFGPYPFSSTGAVVDYAPEVGYALETQTRPVFCDVPSDAIGTIAHELAHMWFGDSVSLTRWSDIWLNEGFATYAEWLWSEHTGGPTAQKLFERRYAPDKKPFWDVLLADPGVLDMFSYPPYDRGAMTLHALRVKVGDEVFFRILKEWARSYRFGNATSADFIRLAERESQQTLGPFFDAWLYRTGKPTSW
ncbi:Peptidase family M1 [Micromonospora viridifaciens]|uniref:Aminopeptidase N n=1 Tax=Micromonospora viridifaciens TaxID=1881 RepID=A0A1C4XZQ7_MICVI|nr:M1 family metallopeptidase [Micromonospora viridifaciens]SCF13846.1 Peptidase family M1 [Micromonospora viridifaciens]